MKAIVWHGKRDVRVDSVPDPAIETPTDAIVRVTSTGLCGSDLHLYEVLAPFMKEGDVLGHEPMGVVEEVGGEIESLSPGDRVVIPFNISCGHCYMCDQGLQSQCETTQVRGAVRLHEALRRGPGRPGAVPARAPRRLQPDQGARGPARRALRLPLRRPPDGLAGGRVCGVPGQWQRDRAGARPDPSRGQPYRA